MKYVEIETPSEAQIDVNHSLQRKEEGITAGIEKDIPCIDKHDQLATIDTVTMNTQKTIVTDDNNIAIAVKQDKHSGKHSG